MNSKLLISIMAGLLIGGLAAVFFFIVKPQMANKPVELAPTSAPLPSPTSEPVSQNKKYQSDSGFSFEYPSDVTIKENQPDKTSYADLVLTSAKEDGSITVKIADTKLKDLAAWQKANKTATASAGMKTTLADMDALNIEKAQGITLVSIGDGVLYMVETMNEGNKSYWDGVFTTIVSSFSFEAPAPEPTAKKSSGASGATTGDSDIILEEETVE